MRKILMLALLGVAPASFAGTYFYDGILGPGSPTFHHPNASTVGTGQQYYNALQFTVSTTGAYTIESASPNTTGTPSNALDTFIAVYANTFTPATPGAGIGFNDDFTGTLTVLPGPYGGTVGTAGTGFTGAQPASRLLNLNLTAGTQYFLVNTSFRSTDFVGTGTTSQPRGHYYTGISGPGNINPVPEPASMAALAIGGIALLRRRKKA
jgi:hypothetical protein